MSTINSLDTAALTGRFDTTKPGALSRLTGWLRRGAGEPADAPTELAREVAAPDAARAPDAEDRIEDANSPDAADVLLPAPGGPRGSLFRRWSRRDQAAEKAIENLQNGLGTLVDLMHGIGEHMARQSARQDELLTGLRQQMERQGLRQDELLTHLARLPGALEQLPENLRAQTELLRAQTENLQGQSETMRVQSETLSALRQHAEWQTAHAARQAENQSAGHGQVVELLDRMTLADATHGRTLKAVETRIEALGRNDQAIWSSVKSVTGTAEASTRVLEQLRDQLAHRDGGLQQVVQRQGNRFNSLLVSITSVSVAALTAAAVFGYLILSKVH